MTQTLLVTGAGGKLGRLVIDSLLAANAGKIVAATRDPAKLADLAARGVEVRRADFDDPASLGQAFAGVDRVLIISTDALDETGRRLKQQQAAVSAAAAAGVKHLVYTSMPNPEPGSAIIFAPDHYGTEQAIKASGVAYTILRCSWYQENLAMALPNVLASGQWFTAAGQGKVSHVARADIAAAAAAALASTSTASATLDVTSEEAFTVEEIAALTSGILGKPIAVVHVTDEQLIAGLQQHGVPEFMSRFIACFDTNTRLGGMTAPTAVVRELTGHAPRPLKDYLAALKDYLAAQKGSW